MEDNLKIFKVNYLINHCLDLPQILVRAECVCCPWLLAEKKVATIGLSGVRALPLAAGRNEGGHYFR